MKSARENCEFKDKCGTSGHFLLNGAYVRCKCLVMDMNRRKLGAMYSSNIDEQTVLKSFLDKDLRIEGPLASIREHVSACLLTMIVKNERFMVLDAYRFLEIYLQQDTEIQHQAEAVDPELLVILLGFADPRNKYLPELLLQVMNRRELIEKPTWVVMGIDLTSVATRYQSTQLQEKIATFKKVVVQ